MDHLTIGRSGMPGQWFIKCRTKAYRSPSLADAFNQAMWITPAMNLIERLQRHLAAGTIGTVRGGKSGISDDHTGLRFFCTFYCASPLTDTGAHGATFDAALAEALDKLDAKIGARLPVPAIAPGTWIEAKLPLPSLSPVSFTLPGMPPRVPPVSALPLPLPKGPTNG